MEDVEAAMDDSSNYVDPIEILDLRNLKHYVGSRFDFLYDKLEIQNGCTVACLDKIYEFIKSTGNSYHEFDQSFTSVNSKLNDIENRVRNHTAYYPLDDIYFIGLCDPLNIPGSYFDIPNKLPRKVIQFWYLKQRKNC